MSERMATGFRLMRELLQAQIAIGEMHGQTGREADAEWHRRNDALQAASVAWERFLATPDRDWKMKQAGERE